MASADCCGKAFLIVVNLLFGLIGFTMLVGGLVLIFGWSLVGGFVEPILDGLTDLGSDSAATTTDSDTAMENFRTLINYGAYSLAALGGMILVVCCCGCCGACCSVKCMLLSYSVVMLIMVVLEIVIISLWSQDMFVYKITDKISDWINTEYVGVADFGLASLVVNIVQLELSCCGTWGTNQWSQAEKWERDIEINGVIFEQIIPMSCCIVTGSFPSVEPEDSNCTISPNILNAYLDDDCEMKLQDYFNDMGNYIYGFLGLLMIFEIALFLVAACVVVKVFDKSDNERKNKVHPEGGESKPGRPGKKGGAQGQQAAPLPAKGGAPPPYEQGAGNPGTWDF